MPLDPATIQPAHRHFAAAAFNACWELIDLTERTPEQDREMIRRAEASFWHWQQFEGRTAENDSIGYWQLARAYTLANEPTAALHYAQANLDVVRQHQLPAFCEAYAWESLARCHAKAGRSEECQAALTAARSAAERIPAAEDKAALEADLQTVEAML